MALFDGDFRKQLWAADLFVAGTRRLSEEVYLWVHAWNPTTDTGPYGYHRYLADVEPLLIGTTYEAYPDRLLNRDGVPDDAPANTRSPTITPISAQPSGDEQRTIDEFD